MCVCALLCSCYGNSVSPAEQKKRPYFFFCQTLSCSGEWLSGGCCDPSREKRRGDTLKIVECVLLLLYCIYVQDSIQLVGLPCSIAAPLSKVKQVRLTTRGRQQQPIMMYYHFDEANSFKTDKIGVLDSGMNSEKACM